MFSKTQLFATFYVPDEVLYPSIFNCGNPANATCILQKM